MCPRFNFHSKNSGCHQFPSLRLVRLGVEELDVETGADLAGVCADKSSAVVDVELLWKTAFAEGLFDCVVEGMGVFAQVVLGVGKEAGVVVNEDAEVCFSTASGIVRIKEAGAGAEVAHPELVDDCCLEFFGSTVRVRSALSFP